MQERSTMARPGPLRSLLLAGASTLVLSAVKAPRAAAQSVDYGALEQVFGEPVTTSATGKPQKVSEAPVTMEIITQDDIRRSGADNLPDVLQFVSGVDVRRDAFGDADVGIRGYNQAANPHLLVLLNGRQVYFDDYGVVAWNTIPVELDEIRQIEIVKGPNSALFGFNAASGVINIITYDPLSDSVNSVTAQTGTQSLAEGSAVATVHAYDVAGLRISAGGYLASEFYHPDAYGQVPEPERGSLSADGKAKLAPGVELELSASKSSSQTYNEIPAGILLSENWRTNSVGTQLAADTQYGLINLNAYHNGLAFDLPLLHSPETDDVYVVQASDLFKLSADHTLRVGVEYRNNTGQSSATSIFGGTIGYSLWAGSLMWNWDITPDLSLTNAVRVDSVFLGKSGPTVFGPYLPNGLTLADYDRSFTAESFNSGLVYKVTERDTLRLMAARGLQAPSLVDFGYVVNGNPDVNPTIVGNYELGYDRDVPGLGSTLRTSLFYQTQTDVIGGLYDERPVLTPIGPVGLIDNIGSSHELGLELGVKGHSESGFRWFANYSFASVTDDLAVARTNPPTSNLDYQHGTPEHTVKFGGGYSIGKWEFDSAARWESSWTDYKLFVPVLPPGTPLLSAVRVANYLSINARIGYKLTERLTLSGTAEQFNQARIVTSNGLPTERRFLAKITAQF
jgi:iron complex outermembrane receptor protein